MFMFIFNAEANYDYERNIYMVFHSVISFHNAYTQKGKY